MSRATDNHTVPIAPRDMPTLLGRPPGGWRARMFDVIFGTDTPAGRRFDLALVAIILLSILTVVLDSVPDIGRRYAVQMSVLEWTFTIFFTLEYIARLVCVQRPMRYARSFYGVIDLVSVLPTWISLLVPGSQVFLDVRILRLLRIFRILKLTRYVDEYTRLGEALVASKRKIMVFLSVVLMLILILGTVMYVVEGPESGFTSIPMAMYWATVTITTVGYGDITPHTHLGKAIASFMMLLGWGILAVPTGIVSAEMTSQKLSRHAPRGEPRSCSACGSTGHDPRAQFCKDCGAGLAAEAASTVNPS
jgi:voltage-gated potassium channel